MNSLRSAASQFLSGIAVGGAFLTGCAVSFLAIDAILTAAFPNGRFHVHPAAVLDRIRRARPRRSSGISSCRSSNNSSSNKRSSSSATGRVIRSSPDGPVGPGRESRGGGGHRPGRGADRRSASLGRGDGRRLHREPHLDRLPIGVENVENKHRLDDKDEPYSINDKTIITTSHRRRSSSSNKHNNKCRHYRRHAADENNTCIAASIRPPATPESCRRSRRRDDDEGITRRAKSSDDDDCFATAPEDGGNCDSGVVTTNITHDDSFISSNNARRKLKKVLRFESDISSFRTDEKDRSTAENSSAARMMMMMDETPAAADDLILKLDKRLRKRAHICIMYRTLESLDNSNSSKNNNKQRSLNPSRVVISPPTSRNPSAIMHAIRYKLRHISSCSPADPMRFQCLRRKPASISVSRTRDPPFRKVLGPLISTESSRP